MPAYDVQDEVDALVRRGVRYSAARELLQRLAHLVMLRIEATGDFPGDTAQDAIARSAPVKAYAKDLWPALDPAGVLFRLFDPEALAAAQRGPRRGRTADAAVAEPSYQGRRSLDPGRHGSPDELADLLERTPSLGHVVLDEAQDLSPMQLRAVGRRASTGSLTVLGDIAQGTTPWATGSRDDAMGHPRPAPARARDPRPRGFRVPARVIEARGATAVRDGAGSRRPAVGARQPRTLDVVAADPEGRSAAVVAVIEALRQPGSVGVIAPDAFMTALSAALTRAGVPHGRLDADHGDDEDRQVELVPASIAKGLEFDRVVVVEPAVVVAAEPDLRTGLRCSTSCSRAPSRR